MRDLMEPNRIAPPETRLGFLVYRAGIAVAEAYEQVMKPLGFRPAEVGLLTHLATHGADHVRGVARVIGVSPQTVVNLTKDLERRGLVTRAPSPADERVVVIALTAEGQMLLSEADAAARRFDERISALIGDLGPEVAAGLTRILNADRLADPDQRSGT